MALERIKVLNAEITSDPLGRGYSSMNDQEAADDLNTQYRSKAVTEVLSHVVFEATIPTEYDALTAAQKDRYGSMLAMGALDPSGTNTRAVFAQLFGGGTTTRANLLALDTKSVSRAVELLGEDTIITAVLVAAARSYVA